MQDASWVSELPVSDEAILSLRRRLARELEVFAAAQGIAQPAHDQLLGLVSKVLLRDMDDLITARPVAAIGASHLVVRFSF